MCLYAISFTVFEADLQIYWLPVLLFFTVTCIIMFLFLWVIYRYCFRSFNIGLLVGVVSGSLIVVALGLI